MLKAVAKRGRPSIYSPDLVENICVRLMMGESLLTICRDPQMPARSIVYEWLATHPEFSDKYARARDIQADALADEILEIADSTEGDVSRDKLRIDSRKWLAAKLFPRRYGDKGDLIVTDNQIVYRMIREDGPHGAGNSDPPS